MAMLSEDQVRTDVKQWLADNWDPDVPLAQWWDLLARSGYSAPSFPEDCWGKGFNRRQSNVVNEEIANAGAVGPPSGLGYALAAPTIVAHGSDEQKQDELLRILNGQDGWCQLFSEPNAGSDLAGLQTKAERDGDEYIINGQKVWTSTAQLCNLGMLVARTDADAPKHRGLSYFKFDMDQPGVEVRPLKEMTGRAMFNEVFMSDCRVHVDDMIGDYNAGWAVTNTTLMAERSSLGSGGSGASGNAFPGPKAGNLEKNAGEFSRTIRTGGTGGGGRDMAQNLIDLAVKQGVNTDPNIRQGLAELYTLGRLGRWGALRMKVKGTTMAMPNIAKLQMSEMLRLNREMGNQIIGADGMLMGEDTLGEGYIQEATLFSPGPSIYGGTDEVQKNIIGERVLGLPKEPGPDKTTPFKELPANQ